MLLNSESKSELAKASGENAEKGLYITLPGNLALFQTSIHGFLYVILDLTQK